MNKLDIFNVDSMLQQLAQEILILDEKSDFQNLCAKYKKLENEINTSSNLWTDHLFMSSKMKELNTIKETVDSLSNIFHSYKDIQDLILIAKEAKDSDLLNDIKQEISSLLILSEKEKTKLFFSSSEDKLDCYLEIHAGSGGADAQDFAGMLLRMYSRWLQDNAYSISTIEYNSSNEAKNGIKSVILKVSGTYAYGFLKVEEGVHRLVRQSPFNSDGKRHTSFAAIDVYPIGDDIEIEILDKDLKIDTFRASGAGGQHVNTTDSAVRILHIPTSIVVQCQSERSQHKNKATALSLLRSRLFKLKTLEQKNNKSSEYASKRAIDFGSQVRSYILHPYNLVKDHRSDFETQNTKAVLDGNLSDIIVSVLSKI